MAAAAIADGVSIPSVNAVTSAAATMNARSARRSVLMVKTSAITRAGITGFGTD